jgi:hypothetical protein
MTGPELIASALIVAIDAVLAVAVFRRMRVVARNAKLERDRREDQSKLTEP